MAEAGRLVAETGYDHIMATGYGRNLFEIAVNAPTATEIKAHATGTRVFFPDIRMVMNIGGQDSKVIALSEDGTVKMFEMNDHCAAGTRKFFDIMARALGMISSHSVVRLFWRTRI